MEDRVFVADGACFLGSDVAKELEHRGVSSKLIFVSRSADYDLDRREDVVRVLTEVNPAEVVLHVAATAGGIGANREHPGRFCCENTVMGLRLMEEARRRGVEIFVTVGTVCSYRKHTPVPFQAEYLWDGYPEETNAPYGIAREMLQVQGQASRQEYGFSVLYPILVSIYGLREDFAPATSHVIPAPIRKSVDAQEAGEDHMVPWGDSSPPHVFLAEDAARGLVLATERYDAPAPVILGTGEELVRLIAELTDYESEVRWDTTKPNGQPRRCLDTSRAEERFGFEAEVPLKEGLERTID